MKRKKPFFGFTMEPYQFALLQRAAATLHLTDSEWARRAIDQVLRDGLRNKICRPQDLARCEGRNPKKNPVNLLD